MLYFLAATPYSTTFCRETWHNRAAEAAHAVTFDFSSGFYNCFPITGCRIRRFLCGIHHRRFLSRRDGSSARLLLYFLCFTSRLYNALPREMSIAEPPQDRKNSRKGAKKLQYREWRCLWTFSIDVINVIKMTLSSTELPIVRRPFYIKKSCGGRQKADYLCVQQHT